jgi:PPOX class probable FMN-dependent enzyme
MPFDHALASPDDLRRHYAQPHPVVLRKVQDRIDGGARRFIARSPFLVLATSGAAGADASPRGGPPGFVTVLDDHRLAFGDLSGNRRLDSFENVVADPVVGLLFLIPGLGETLRVNGRGTVTTDPAVLDACTVEGVRPGVALGVDVDAVYIHCAKAFRRSGLWDPASWPAEDERPTAGAVLVGHLGLDQVTPEAIDADLEQGYAATLWKAGD